MTGPEFWQIFLSAHISDEKLAALGDNVGRQEKLPTPLGFAALSEFKNAVKARGVDVPIIGIFTVLKGLMPGVLQRRALLDALAGDYLARKPWARMRPEIQGYVNAVAGHMPPLPVMPAAPVAASEAPLAVVAATPKIEAAPSPTPAQTLTGAWLS